MTSQQQQQQLQDQQPMIRVIFNDLTQSAKAPSNSYHQYHLMKKKSIQVQLKPSLNALFCQTIGQWTELLSSTSRCRTMDVLQDALAQDSAIIECDSLMFYLLRQMVEMNSSSKKDNNISLSSTVNKNDKVENEDDRRYVGFNWLQYTFLLERFVGKLVDRGVNLSLVAFECMRSAWYDQSFSNVDPTSQKVWSSPIVRHQGIGLVRKLTMQHFLKMKLKVTLFDNWWASPFVDFFKEDAPSCLLACAPGEHSLLMDAFMMHSLRRIMNLKIDCQYVSLGGIRFTVNTLFAYGWNVKVEENGDNKGGRRKWRDLQRDGKLLKKALIAAEDILYPISSISYTPYEKFIPESLLSMGDILQDDLYKISLVLHCMNHLVEPDIGDSPSMINRIQKLIIATLLVQSKLSLDQRTEICRKQVDIYSNVTNYVMKLYRVIDNVIFTNDGSSLVIQHAPSLMDLIDENLLYYLTDMYVRNITDDNSDRQPFMLSELREVYSLMTSLLSDDVNELSALSEHNMWMSYRKMSLPAVIDKQIIDHLYPIRDSFVDSVLGKELVDTFRKYEYSAEDISQVLEDENKTKFEKEIFYEKYHWHSTRLLESDFLPMSEKQKRDAEIAERQLNQYAQSLRSIGVRKTIVVEKDVYGKKYHQAFYKRAVHTVLKVEQYLSGGGENQFSLTDIDNTITILSRLLESVPCEKLIARLLIQKTKLIRETSVDKDRTWRLFHSCNVTLTFLNQMIQFIDGLDMQFVIPRKQYLFFLLCEIGFTEYATRLAGQSKEHKYHCVTSESVAQITDVARFQLTHSMFDDDDNTILDISAINRSSTRPLSQDLGFKPDPWQWDLIDMVNRNESVLVSAPTSSGKTFIAFYCIERVLRESNDGVVVFVCPSKALVNQTYAEVCSRFTKSLPSTMNMVGMFTADDQIHPTKCQVLVTVPSCLEIMLLSAQAHEWSKKLKYVIFDEVHCINERGTGGVWEHLLLLIKCPFLALSATIGNPSEFHEWLTVLEKPDTPKVNLVLHKTRPRDLLYMLYEPNRGSALHEVHPLSSVLLPLTKINLERIPAMTSQQCLLLVARALQSTCTKLQEAFAEIVPARVFTEARLITREEVRSYQKMITDTIWRVYSENNDEVRSGVISLISDIGKNVNDAYQRLWSKTNRDFGTPIFVRDNLISLIFKMEEENLLPTIMFVFSRRVCNTYASVALGAARKKPFWKLTAQQEEELNKTYDQLIASRCKVPPEVLNGLKFGIATHHGGLSANYLKEIERLFRKGCLKVCFATGTLATGIHMPARSVVMAGDSIYLNSLIFHQCSGRSGRRGFDARGKIILFGLPEARVQRLLCTKAPDILGDMSISTSFILRMLVLYRDTIQYCEHKQLPPNQRQALVSSAVDNLMRLLNQPLFAHGKSLPLTKQLVRHQFRFSVEFLRRQDYIDNEGRILQFTGLTTHLFYIEPLNFLFMYFLRKGLFHEVLAEHKQEEAERIIFLVICHIIKHCSIMAKGKGVQILPSLPLRFELGRIEFNNTLSRTFSTYINIYAQHHMDEEAKSLDNTLPISKISFANRKMSSEESIRLNLSGVASPSPCSVFTTLSRDCTHISPEAMTSMEASLRQDIHIDSGIIPFAFNKDKLNAYAYLLMFNQDVTTLNDLMDKSMMDAVELEQNLRQFDADLRKIMVSLELLSSGNTRDQFVTTIVRLSTTFTRLSRSILTEQVIRVKKDEVAKRKQHFRQPPNTVFVPSQVQKEPRTNNRQPRPPKKQQEQQQPQQQPQQPQQPKQPTQPKPKKEKAPIRREKKKQQNVTKVNKPSE